MRKKVITYKEVKLSDEIKNKCIKYLNEHSKGIYFDYRDKLSLEQIDKLMESEEAYYDLENEIWEWNLDYICQLERELIEEMKNEIPEIAEIELEDLREEFADYIKVNCDISPLIRNTPDVRVRIVVNTNYEGVGYNDRGKGDFRGNEYIRDIKKLLRNKYDKKSFQQELDNIMSNTNQLIFYFKASVSDLIGIKERFKTKITIPKEAWCGFFDNWCGSGSVLEIKLLKDVRIKKQWGKTEYDKVDIVLDEAHKYSVEQVYGLCNVPEVKIEVK